MPYAIGITLRGHVSWAIASDAARKVEILSPISISTVGFVANPYRVHAEF